MLYLGVFVPRLVYGDAVWGETVKDHTLKRLLLGAQRGALLSVTGAYRTRSKDAMRVLAGVLPLDLEARQWGRKARRRRNGLGKEQEAEIEEEGFAEWQARWEASKKGRLTYSYFPSVKERLKCRWLVVDHESSQFLTGHGGCMAYFHRFSRSETDECQSCGALDTAEHVVFNCEALTGARKALRDLVERIGSPWPCELRTLVSSPELWKEFRSFMHAAVASRGHVLGQ